MNNVLTFNADYFSFSVIIESREKKQAIAELDYRKMNWECKKDKKGWKFTIKNVCPADLCLKPLQFLLDDSLRLLTSDYAKVPAGKFDYFPGFPKMKKEDIWA